MKTASVLLALFLTVAAGVGASSLPFVGIGARHGTVDMEDVNDLIRDADENVEASLDMIAHASGLGAEFGLVTGPRTALVFRWERIFARTEASGEDGSIAFDMGAHAFTGSAELRRFAEGRAVFGLGFGGGVILAAGEADRNGLGISGISGDTEGAGPVLHGYLFAEFPLRGRLHVVPSVGYRHARVNALEADGRKLFTSGGAELGADYSGYSIALSLRYYLGE